MPNNHVLLETITVGAAGASSVTFNNIPQTGYTDLKIFATSRTTDDFLNISFNGSTANLSSRTLGSNASGAFSTSASTGLLYGLSNPTSWTANTFSNAEIYIPNYVGSTNKSFSVNAVTENNGTSITLAMIAGLWSNTAAITSVTLTPTSGSFVANSTFSLYGIAAYGTTPVVAPKAEGGNIVANDGTYWYHAFTSSGYFVPQQNLSCSVLVVAGGGGGGSNNPANGDAGGGGAGGLLGFTSQSLTTTNYAITVGAGGTSSAGGLGTVGSDSQFQGLTLVKGGGRGANRSSNVGGNGGSGGGGSYPSGAGGSPTSGQGNAGGSGAPGQGASGGGGGAGGAGGNGVYDGGNGGVGVSTYSAWGLATSTGQNISGTVWYAGGGAGSDNTDFGGTGGSGGGGNANTTQAGAGSSGLANTGGGGGAGGNATGGAGGSGIVIIRYPIAS